MRILLFETTAYYPSSPLFLEALIELSNEAGHTFEFVDEATFGRVPSFSRRVASRIIGTPMIRRKALNRELLSNANSFQPDLVLITKGANLSVDTLSAIKRCSNALLINYATDDPFNLRVSNAEVIAAIRLFDLYICPVRAIADEVKGLGCKQTAYIPFGYKPSVHFHESTDNSLEYERYSSDVVFLGGADEHRLAYFNALVKAIPDLKLHLYGGYWHREPSLRRFDKGTALGRDFRLALNGAKIAVNMVRRPNRSVQNMRTFELPACGAFTLADRTQEHLELFAEDREAVYFEGVEEFVGQIRRYLPADEARHRIAIAGHNKLLANAHSYKDRLAQIISLATH